MNKRRLENQNKRRLVEQRLTAKNKCSRLARLDILAHIFFKTTLLWNRGRKNAESIITNEISFTIKELPEKFDNTKILFMSDLHIRGKINQLDKISKMISKLEYDFCILGGDYCDSFKHEKKEMTEIIAPLLKLLLEKSPVYAVLGNHDSIDVADFFSSFGVEMLINDSVVIARENEKIALVGIDDCHRYKSDDFEIAEENLGSPEFKILISHSPEKYQEAQKKGYNLYFAGHTHGGQICLPGGFAPITNAQVPRKIAAGKWQYKQMQGYTSRGVGSSKTPLRFNCPPEICLIALSCFNANR